MNNESVLSCDYCGLPIPGRRLTRRSITADAGPIYCCGGCRFAASIFAAENTEGHAHQLLVRLGLATFCTMNVLAFSMALWSRDVYGAHPSDTTAFAGALDELFRYATLLFAVPVLVLLGGPLFANAYQAVRRTVITADLLVLLGVVSAFAYSITSVVRGEGRIYFEVGCVVLAFLTLGKWFEATGRLKMNQSLDELTKLLPAMVHIVSDGIVKDEPRESVRVGDTIRVLAGERFAIDGQIISGTAEVDEQIVTGESRTIAKVPGDPVFGGTLNIDGDLRVAVTAASGDETVSRILDMVRKARHAPGRFQRLADRIAAWFVPVVAVIALGAAWHHGRAEGIDAGILSGLAVALIACPCAFALATPMAIWTALGCAARYRILFRNGQALEQLARVQLLFFDKTGTLTSGEAEVEGILLAESASADEVLERVVPLVTASNHTFSQAIRRYAGGYIRDESTTSVTTVPGKGLWKSAGDNTTYLGSRRMMRDFFLAIPHSLASRTARFEESASLTYLAWADRVQAVFVLREQLRSEAQSAIASCAQLGVQAVVLTGDNSARATWLQQRFATKVVAEQLPVDKLATIQAARRRGSVVGMIGDGINDAPALAAADVCIAMGCGADLSRDSAAMCLLSNDLAQIPWSILLARKTTRIIRQNLFWAFIYNIAGIGLAISGHLNPIWAGLAMVVSSVFVVTNSLRLNHFPAPIDTPSPTKPQLPLNFPTQQAISIEPDVLQLEAARETPIAL